MDEPKKLEVLKALTTWLEGITYEDPNGTNTLLGKVFRGITVYGDQRPLPMLSILESPRPDFPEYAGIDGTARNETWVLLLQGWVKDDKTNPTDLAYYLAWAVEQRLAALKKRNEMGDAEDPETFMLGGRVHKIEFGPSVVRPPDAALSAKAFFYMPLRLGLASVVG